MNVGGGERRSISTRLCCGLSEERSWAVARPIPDKPQVITMVFGVDFRVVRAAASDRKSDMVDDETSSIGSCMKRTDDRV